MRLLKLSVVLLVVALAGCNGKQGLAARTAADKRVLNRLNERIRRLDFNSIALPDVIQLFRGVSGVNIYVHRKAVEAAGPKRYTLVKLHLQDVPFHEALTQCLGSLNSSTPITYALADGVVLISTPEEAARLARLMNTPPAAGKTKADKRVLNQLNERIRAMYFLDIELKDAIQFLRDVSELEMHVQWDRLTSVGVTKRAPVNVHLEEVTLHTALILYLAEASREKPLGYIIKDGAIHISTPEGLKELRETPGQPKP